MIFVDWIIEIKSRDNTNLSYSESENTFVL